MTLPNTTDMVLEYDVALLRAVRLGANCAPVAAATPNGKIITVGAVSAEATPVRRDGAEITFEGGGDEIATVKKRDKTRYYDISGSIITPDLEFFELLFGGVLDVADVGQDFAGNTIAYGAPDLTSPDHNGVYLEIVGLLTYEGAEDCVGTAGPAARGHVFPRSLLTPGSVSLSQNEAYTANFEGQAKRNPTANLDPFGDYPGASNAILNQPYAIVDYTQAQFDAMVAAAAPGTQTV